MKKKKVLRHVSSAYPNVNLNKPKSYYSYNATRFSWGNMADYYVLSKVGSGRYSEVYRAFYKTYEFPCAVKILKPIRFNKVKREIHILQNLYGGPSIIPLYDIMLEPVSLTTVLVFKYVDSIPLKDQQKRMSPLDIKNYMYRLLQALEYSHSHGIFHRDVKPQNIVSSDPKSVDLIDWGLADFYFPKKKYSSSVGTRYFKSPEILLKYNYYDYSMDVYAAGCTMAAMLFRKDYMFKGVHDMDQITQVARVLGSDAFYRFANKYGITISSDMAESIGNFRKKDLSSFVTNKLEVSSDALDLLEKMLMVDIDDRISARDALAHPYFDEVRQSAHSEEE